MSTLNRLNELSRRRFLRGMVGGGVVTLGLPLLNCFLNNNGTALASGAPMPMRFGTWFWGLGMNSKIFVPSKIGPGYDVPEELSALAARTDVLPVLMALDTASSIALEKLLDQALAAARTRG